jgi:UDP-N-acetylglucosamine 1-carboxyvinyltransferase
VLSVSRFVVKGGKKLFGEIEVQGAKNSALPILSAAVLTRGENIFYNCPRLTDVDACLRILRYLGCDAKVQNGAVIINSDGLCESEIPDSLMREMRSSIVFLGAILARTGCAKLSFPGGCELGPRPIDLHLKALRKMGAKISERHGSLVCKAENGLKGARIDLSFPSVGATENIILAAVLAEGTTTIINAAREPEICDLCEYLNSAGAKIYGFGEGEIVIDGVEELYAVSHNIIPDRIVAATLMSAAAVTKGEVTLRGVIRNHLSSVIPVFEETGCKIRVNEGDLLISAPERLRAMPLVRTMPYPGFPTDAQAPLMAAACVCEGTSVFVENIFENRFKHVGELSRLGADINVQGKVAVVNGVKTLYGAPVEAQDLRGAASLITAALAAEGTTEIGGIEYLERGYEDFEIALGSLGADVRKI